MGSGLGHGTPILGNPRVNKRFDTADTDSSTLKRGLTLGLGLLMATALAGCGWFGGKDREDRIKERSLAAETIYSIGVNAFLWQASLNTLSFMPMADVDSQGGVIITDWFANPADPTERSKVTVYIVDKQLRADALKVSVFKQRMASGQWIDDADTSAAARDITDAILIEARRLRLAQLPSKKK